MAKVIVVEIDEGTGDFSVDLTGFKGKGCGDVIKVFDALGKKTVGVTKPEYHDHNSNVVRK